MKELGAGKFFGIIGAVFAGSSLVFGVIAVIVGSSSEVCFKPW